MGRLFTVTIGFAAALVSSPSLARCEYPGDITSGLNASPGHIEFMQPSKLQPFKDRLPKVESQELQAILNSPETIWYDESSMVFTYQDSVEVVTGVRANCVGRQVGEDNAGSVIGKLTKLFGSDYRFMFPFRKVAGTDNVDNLYALNFWSVPRKNGNVLPTRYWKNSSRGHWYWAFPIGTIFGEVLYQKAPDGIFYVFEIRTRRRYSDGWAPDVFRPFARAKDMADAIEQRRPQWQSNPDLKRLVDHLRNPATLTPIRWETKIFAPVFPAIDGYLDRLPDTADSPLIKELLTQTTFVSVEGMIWKENAGRETYAPSSDGNFSIVPKNYELGIIPVNEISCNRCHNQVSRRLGDFEFDVQLYGEVWGEDRIFTWHPFQVKREIFGTFDEGDGSRAVNPRLVQAGLVKNGKPSGEPDYRPLPSVFVPYDRKQKR